MGFRDMKILLGLALLLGSSAAFAQATSFEQAVYNKIRCDKVIIHEDGSVTFSELLIIDGVGIEGKSKTSMNGVQIDQVAIKKCRKT
jgi:hypothetical protein